VTDAASIIGGWKERLLRMARHPPYVFRDTPPELIERHRERLTTFAGYPPAEVTQAEESLGVRFPALFRAFLLEMGKWPGELFGGSDLAGIGDFARFRADALKLMAETDAALSLPADAVVFLIHQGYTFLFLRADGGHDGAIFQYTEAETESRAAANSFEAMVDAELGLMESNWRGFHEDGGYYLTLHPDGGGTEEHPALDSGDRPLGRARSDKPWWRFWR